ncbi:hypothetical protein Tco_0890357 [Tanacetum coccineum]|uniref:Uncharacterized protein n=1 Tax=Tanacetum coccineum TaxID=301880 RepID=A0ABQ5C086_9ASTR
MVRFGEGWYDEGDDDGGGGDAAEAAGGERRVRRRINGDRRSDVGIGFAAQLVPQYKPIGRCNNYAVLQSILCSPECKIVELILLDHCLIHALTATADVLAVLGVIKDNLEVVDDDDDKERENQDDEIEFKTHAPKIITKLFKDFVQTNVIHVHPTTISSTPTDSSADLQYQLYIKMKRSLQDRADNITLWEALRSKFEKYSTSNTSCRVDDFHSYHDEHQNDDAPPEGEKKVKRSKKSKSSKSARGSSSKHSRKDSTTYVSKQQSQHQEWDAWEEENVVDKDEVIPEDVTPELITESQNVDKRVPTIFDHPRIEATLRDSLSNLVQNAEENGPTSAPTITTQEQSTSFMENQIVWESRQQDIPRTIPKILIFYGQQRNPNEPPRPLYNKDLFFLKCGNTKEKKYILSLHKIHAEEFPEPDLEEKLNRWVRKEFKTFNEDARLSIQHWNDSWHKRVYKKNQKKVRKNPEDYYSNQRITSSFKDEKRVMYLEEIVKFYDATLEKVLNEVKLRMFESKFLKKPPLLGELDQDIMKAYEREISKRLSHRHQMRRWESFVNERLILPTMKRLRKKYRLSLKNDMPPRDKYLMVSSCSHTYNLFSLVNSTNSNQQTLADSGANKRPPMLEKGNYIPWESRFKRFLDNKLEDGERMWNSIQNSPYQRPMVVDPTNPTGPILEPLLMHGSEITTHVRHSRLMDEFDKFAAKEGESLDSVHERLTTLVNIMDHNNVRPIPVAINTKFLNCLQQEWSKYVTMVRYNQTGPIVSYDVLYDQLVQFEPHVLASRAKKAAKNHDPLALIAHLNASSSHSHTNSSYSLQSYYVTHPPSVDDYDDEYQGELQGNSQADKLTIAMMLLARAISQKFSTPTNNRLPVSSNIRNQAVGETELKGLIAGDESKSDYLGLFQETESYSRKADVHRNKCWLAMKDGAGSNLSNEENDFMLDTSYGEELEELTAAAMLMARLQPTDENAETVPSYDAKAVSQFVENNGGASEHDLTAHDEYHEIQMLAYNVQHEAENQKRLNNELS